jgi:hypothetical protein
MNTQKGSSIIGIIATIAVAILAGMYIQAKTDIINHESNDLVTELGSESMMMEKEMPTTTLESGEMMMDSGLDTTIMMESQDTDMMMQDEMKVNIEYTKVNPQS